MSRIDLYPSKNSAPHEAEIQTCTVAGTKIAADVQVQGGTVAVSGGEITEDRKQLTKRIDFISESEFYKGEAVPGSSMAAAVWRVQKVTIAGDGDVQALWAGGTANFDKVWDNRAALSYS
jgi:hypothetical protein